MNDETDNNIEKKTINDVEVITTQPLVINGRRIWLITAVVISSLVLLLCVAGIGGTWVARAATLNMADGLFASANRLAEVGRDAGIRLDTRLLRLETTTNRVGSAIQQVGGEVSNRGVLLPLLPTAVEQELESAVERLRELMATIRGVVTAVTSLIDAVNRVPFINIPVSDLEQIETLQTQIGQLQEDVSRLATRIRDFRQGTADEINAGAALVGEIEAEIVLSRQRLATLDEGLVRLQAQTVVWAQRLRTIVTITAVVLTLILAWVSYALVWLIKNHITELRHGSIPLQHHDGL